MATPRTLTSQFNLDEEKSLPDILQKLQDECYRLLPTELKVRIQNGESLNLTAESLGYEPGTYPYLSEEELEQNEKEYAADATALLYEVWRIMNSTGVANKQWDSYWRATFLASVCKQMGMTNALNLKRYLTSLAPNKLRVPQAINSTTYELACMVRTAYEKILADDLVPVKVPAIKQSVEEMLSHMLASLKMNIFYYESMMESLNASVEEQNQVEEQKQIEAPFQGETKAEEVLIAIVEEPQKTETDDEEALLPLFHISTTEHPENDNVFQSVNEVKKEESHIPIKSSLFNQIIYSITEKSWDRSPSQVRVDEIALCIYAFTESLNQFFREQNKLPYYNAEDILTLYMELLSTHDHLLSLLAEKLPQMISAVSIDSVAHFNLTLLHAAVTAKLDTSAEKTNGAKKIDATLWQAHAEEIEQQFVHQKNICKKLIGTENYISYLYEKIRTTISAIDTTDAYFNVEHTHIVVDAETNERQENKTQINFAEAIEHDFVSPQENTRIKYLAANNPVLNDLIVKFHIMTTLKSTLKDPTCLPEERLRNFNTHLQNNFSLLSKNRDTYFDTFLKIVGFVAATILPVLGNVLFYSRFFVSNGCRYANRMQEEDAMDIVPPEVSYSRMGQVN